MRERLNLRSFAAMVAPPILYMIIQEICGWGVMAVAFFRGFRGAMDVFSMEEISFAATAVGALISIPVFWIMLDREEMRHPSDYRYEKTKTWRLVYVCALGFFAAAGVNRILNMIQIDRLFPGYEETAEVLYSVSLALELLVLGVIVPIAEELVFRGVVYVRMRRCLSAGAAAVWSSLFFGIWHGNVSQGIYAGILGMLMIYAKERYKTIAAPILFHMSANIFAVLLTETEPLSWLAEVSELYPAFLIVELALCIVILWRIEEDVEPKRIKKNREWHREEKEPVDRNP